ncbi:hypothetical protein M427DRAFT_36082 [Gonapodya prolifera JEL478]|uniref:Uncharacterized protein n=1 Tax=Gonapodya prolifera (strain JEL478) TaxID=1344416 RepID=A0A139A3H3_GONPJ|nr:hypothetical protein M427DRAFT_36082 [Gonapodya prolifera JEL478]|eukprot:KXS11168.1 hypothetical protein M427DRAFT_36082 [Gonapodya prolifera JEL478]
MIDELLKLFVSAVVEQVESRLQSSRLSNETRASGDVCDGEHALPMLSPASSTGQPVVSSSRPTFPRGESAVPTPSPSAIVAARVVIMSRHKCPAHKQQPPAPSRSGSDALSSHPPAGAQSLVQSGIKRPLTTSSTTSSEEDTSAPNSTCEGSSLGVDEYKWKVLSGWPPHHMHPIAKVTSELLRSQLNPTLEPKTNNNTISIARKFYNASMHNWLVDNNIESLLDGFQVKRNQFGQPCLGWNSAAKFQKRLIEKGIVTHFKMVVDDFNSSVSDAERAQILEPKKDHNGLSV